MTVRFDPVDAPVERPDNPIGGRGREAPLPGVEDRREHQRMATMLYCVARMRAMTADTRKRSKRATARSADRVCAIAR